MRTEPTTTLIRKDLDALYEACDEAVSGSWDKSKEGFEDMQALITQVNRNVTRIEASHAELLAALELCSMYLDIGDKNYPEVARTAKQAIAKAKP